METHMKLSPQEYLSNRAKDIFMDLINNIPNQSKLRLTDSYELSILAFKHESVELNMGIINKEGGTQITQSGYSQVRAEWTIVKNDTEYIAKHSDKWGLSPSIREKEKEVWAVEAKQEPGVSDLMSFNADNQNTT